MSIYSVLTDVIAERARQDAKWGEQHWPDGTSTGWAGIANVARDACDEAAKIGELTWLDILKEEFWEASAEAEWSALRGELIQVAAVCIRWIEDGDSRDV